uniref:Uncharacterized protein n=1 Tax=Aegilops tauschii subsp. strangulata TaxID=200361 RepID=A0A453KNL8_AEGTS
NPPAPSEMDRRKGSGSRDANGGLAEATASRLRFEDADEVAGEVGMEVEESPAAPGEEVIGNDKTSADYYFDSYSHFGTRAWSDSTTHAVFPWISVTARGVGDFFSQSLID